MRELLLSKKLRDDKSINYWFLFETWLTQQIFNPFQSARCSRELNYEKIQQFPSFFLWFSSLKVSTIFTNRFMNLSSNKSISFLSFWAITTEMKEVEAFLCFRSIKLCLIAAPNTEHYFFIPFHSSPVYLTRVLL